MTEKIIPDSVTGKDVDLQATINLATIDEATVAFRLASERLLKPSLWHGLCRKTGATFELIGENLRLVHRKVVEGDYIRINIPGPGPGAGDGYDWVQVALLQHSAVSDANVVGIKLVPTSNPKKLRPPVAHFFNERSSSTLIIRQEKTEVKAFYYGRNETINNHTKSITDNIRNTAIAIGAMAGLSELQWSKLIHAFLENEEK